MTPPHPKSGWQSVLYVVFWVILLYWLQPAIAYLHICFTLLLDVFHCRHSTTTLHAMMSSVCPDLLILHLNGIRLTCFNSNVKLQFGWAKGMNLQNFRSHPPPVWLLRGRKVQNLALSCSVNIDIILTSCCEDKIWWPEFISMTNGWQTDICPTYTFLILLYWRFFFA
jgi:hypothetical protein